MNKDTAKDYLPLVQALAEGKTIQWMNMAGEWHDQIVETSFSASADRYRIKPEPKKQWCRVALKKFADNDCDREFYTWSCDDEHEESAEKNCPEFVRWLTDRIEYTLPEGDA